METLSNLESFVRSAESGSFSAAARRLALTPAAVSRNVAQLEGNLGVRLFQRSTRKLTLTEAGERLLSSVRGELDGIQAALADVSANAGQPAGSLKVSMSWGFGLDYLLPLLPAFLARYPAVLPEWQFENRSVDLIAEGLDVAIGGGFELTPGVVARELARIHVIAVATPQFLHGRELPREPAHLQAWDGIVMRSVQTGRVRNHVLRSSRGDELPVQLKPRVVVNDPEAVTRSVLMGLGIGLIAMPHALPHLESGAMIRLLPDWYADLGPISLYFAGQKLLPAKTRVFVDFVTEQFREQKLARRFSAA